MDGFEILTLLCSLVATVTAFTCCLIEVIAIRDAVTIRERQMKRILRSYFSVLLVVWLRIFLFIGIPESGPYTRLPFVLALLLVPVIFYNMIYVATGEYYRKLSRAHYIFPAFYLAVCIVFSFVSPEGSVRGSDSAPYNRVPQSGGYHIFILSDPLVRSLISFLYGIPCIRMIISFYRRTRATVAGVICRRWLVLFITLTLLLLSNAVLMLMGPFFDKAALWFINITAVSITIQMIILGYSSFNHKSLLLMSVTGRPEEQNEITSPPPRLKEPGITKSHPHPKGINRRQFEDYYITGKRYLDPHVKLTDLIEPLSTNRTTLSSFINRTYGMSFSRLTAQLRLREFEKIRKNPSNYGKAISELVPQAGFFTERNYYLARQNDNGIYPETLKRPLTFQNLLGRSKTRK